MGLIALVLAALLAAAAAGPGSSEIETVTLVLADPLHLGFSGPGDVADGDIAVINAYFKEHFPRAIRVAEQLAERGGPELVYTTHSWLVNLYLNCRGVPGVVCPDLDAQAAFERAATSGRVVWHALPLAAHPGLLDAELTSWGPRATHELDRRFGRRFVSTALSPWLPGFSRSSVPAWGWQGVSGLYVAGHPRIVGPGGGAEEFRPFLWRDEASGAQVTAVWGPLPPESPAGGGGATPRPYAFDASRCATVAGHPAALCVLWGEANGGPPSAEEVRAAHAAASRAFPGAATSSGTLDDFFLPLSQAVKSGTVALATVSSDVGDPFAQTAASDPGRLAELKALLRLRRAASDFEDDPAFALFSALLVKMAEHSFGADARVVLGDAHSWSNGQFERARRRDEGGRFAALEASWVAQRRWADLAVAAMYERGGDGRGAGATGAGAGAIGARGGRAEPEGLGPPMGSLLAGRIARALVELQEAQRPPGTKGMRGGRVEGRLGDRPSPQTPISTISLAGGPWSIELCRETGAIVGLRSDDAPLVDWASPSHPLALSTYSTYGEEDLRVGIEAVARGPVDAAFLDEFGRPGSSTFGGGGRSDTPLHLESWWTGGGGGPGRTRAQARRRSPGAGRDAGPPGLRFVGLGSHASPAALRAGPAAATWLELRVEPGSQDLLVDLVLVNKTATRLPESTWIGFDFGPGVAAPGSLVLNEVGRAVKPGGPGGPGAADPTPRGGGPDAAYRPLWLVGDDGFSVSATADPTATLSVRSLDAAVVALGEPWPTPRAEVDRAGNRAAGAVDSPGRSSTEPPEDSTRVSFLLHQNLWGSVSPQWFPYQARDATRRFRFALHVEKQGGAGREVAAEVRR